MTAGLERAPVHNLESPDISSRRAILSLAAFRRISTHNTWAELYLGLDTETPFLMDDEALAARQEHQQAGKQEAGYFAGRGIRQLGSLTLSKVGQWEDEFAKKRTLDIGSGEGRLGQELARNSKAKVTFLDIDEESMSNIILKKGCSKVVGNGLELPFDDESFEKTLTVFSSLHWAETPVDTVRALNEALRVTETGGSVFAVPVFSSLRVRQRLNPEAKTINVNREDGSRWSIKSPALKVWTLKDHILLNAILNYANNGYCSVTWSGFESAVGTPNELEHYSAIIDKHEPVPPQMFDENLAYANQFMDTGQ